MFSYFNIIPQHVFLTHGMTVTTSTAVQTQRYLYPTLVLVHP